MKPIQLFGVLVAAMALGFVAMHFYTEWREYEARRDIDIALCSSGLKMDDTCLQLIEEGVDIKVIERAEAHNKMVKELYGVK